MNCVAIISSDSAHQVKLSRRVSKQAKATKRVTMRGIPT